MGYPVQIFSPKLLGITGFVLACPVYLNLSQDIPGALVFH
jgi:hypothetical protein